MEKKKKLILLIVVTLVLILGLGVAFAAFSYQGMTQYQKLVAGDIYMYFNETNTLSIEKAMPGDDYDSSDPNNYFEFTITGKNQSNNDIYYDVTLTKGETPTGKEEENRIPDEYLKFKLVEVANDNAETVLFTDKTYSDLTSQRIYVETIPANTNDTYSKKYRLYMVVSENITIGNIEGVDFTSETWNNAFASVKINVTGDFEERKVLSYEDCFETDYEAIINYYKYDPNSSNELYHNPLCTSDVRIPSEIDGQTIRTIGEVAFANKSLTSVVIPNSVTFIANSSFYNNSLTSVEIPASVTTIMGYAFAHNSLTSIEIPNSVTEIGYGAFEDNELISAVISNNITKLEFSTFAENNLTSIVIPPSVTTIEYSAFQDNDLTSVIIPTNVTIIEDNAFGNNSLTSLTFEENSNLQTVGIGAFGNNSLTSIEIPNSVTTIGENAFYDEDTSLETIIIGNGIQYIGAAAFESLISDPRDLTITFTGHTCDAIKNIEASSEDSTKYFPWIFYDEPYYNEILKPTVIGTDGVCNY